MTQLQYIINKLLNLILFKFYYNYYIIWQQEKILYFILIYKFIIFDFHFKNKTRNKKPGMLKNKH